MYTACMLWHMHMMLNFKENTKYTFGQAYNIADTYKRVGKGSLLTKKLRYAKNKHNKKGTYAHIHRTCGFMKLTLLSLQMHRSSYNKTK